jgi:putative FmdB family regulatory protein
MPTYDYECRACDHTFEKFQSMSAGVLRKCPECGKLKLRRLIGCGAGVIFKGSGFYETDYKRKSPSAGGSNGKSEGSCESCPASSGKSLEERAEKRVDKAKAATESKKAPKKD